MAQHHADQQPDLFPDRLLCSFNRQSAAVEQGDGGDHQQNIFGLAPAVENKTGQQEHAVFQPPGHQKVDDQHRREKIIQKG